MAIKSISSDALVIVRLAAIVVLLMMGAGCKSRECAPFRLTLCPIFGYDKRGHFEGKEDSSWVLRYDIRGGKTVGNLLEDKYSPALAVLLVENSSEKDVEIKSPWSSSWRLHIRGYVSRRTTPLLGSSWRNNYYAKIPRGETFALAVGMLEKDLAPYLRDCFVEYTNCDVVVASNLMNIPFSINPEGLDEETMGEGAHAACSRAESYGQTTNLQSAVSLKLYKLLNSRSCNYAARTSWPVMLARNDGEGLQLNNDTSTCFVPGCWALVATNISKETITLRAFDSGYWKLIISYKSGIMREIPVLSVEHDYLNDVISLKPGAALSVICGCKDSICDIDKIDTISVCYIDDEVGQVLRSEELIVGPEN